MSIENQSADATKPIVGDASDSAKSGSTNDIDIKRMVQDSLKDPELLQALATTFANIQNTQEQIKEAERKKLDGRIKIELEAEKARQEEINNAKGKLWYDKRIETGRLPYGKNRQKEVVTEALEWLENEVKENRIPYHEACNLMDLAIIIEELDLNDTRLQFDSKYNEIKDLYTRSDFKGRRIVKPEVLSHAYSETLKQMKTRDAENTVKQRQEHASFNPLNPQAPSSNMEDYPFGDVVLMSIIGANRISARLKDATPEQYKKVYERQQAKFLKNQKDIEPKIINY